MWIKADRMVSLGYGRYVRSDEVAAIEPIEQGRGAGKRTLVWLRGVSTPLVASRTEEAILRDLTDVPEAVEKGRHQRIVLERVARSLDGVPGTLRRRLREREGIDLDELIEEAHKAIA